MFRESNSPIFRSIKLCVTICGTMYPGCCRPVAWVHYTTSCNTRSSAPEVGRVQRPKHVELFGFINKPLLLHLAGVYIIYINDALSHIKITVRTQHCRLLHVSVVFGHRQIYVPATNMERNTEMESCEKKKNENL